MGETWNTYGGRRIVYSVLIGKPEGNKPLGRPRDRWEGNIKVDLQEIEYRCGLGPSCSG
jgi:hypothetical protein